MRWIPSLLAFAATATFASLLQQPALAKDSAMSDPDPHSIVDQQFAAVTPITNASSQAAVAQWLDAVGEILGRVALGGLVTLPPNGAAAVDTLGTVACTDALLQDRNVLRKVLTIAPDVWRIGYWYVPIERWKPAFSAIWTKSVARAKSLLTADESDCEPYDVAVNATSLMIRFTKDNYFLLGEPDSGDNTSGSSDKRSKGYLAFLPKVVAHLSRVPGFSLSETELRAYMNTLPSKRDGMDMSVAFPTYVDTARYKNSDAAALLAFLKSGGAQAQHL